MKIAIDATLLGNRGKGAARYLLSLLSHLAPLDRLAQYYVFVCRRFDTSRLPQEDNFHYRPVDFRKNLYWRLVQLPSILRSEPFDVVHLPSESRTLETTTPCVVTVHEVGRILWGLKKKRGLYQWLSNRVSETIFRRTITKARAIITVSAATKDELVRLYPVDPERVTVIHEAPERIFFEERSKAEREKVRERLGAKEGYILSFATGDSRENLNVVLDAYARAAARLRQKLVFCGANPKVRKDLEERCLRMGIRGRLVVLDYVSDEVLTCLYSAADLYVDISYYEGFGLQPCEAMASGTPVIASSIPAFIEVLGSAAKLVPVNDPGALCSAMTETLENQREWQERSRLSRQRACEFSWQRGAEQTLAIYQAVADSGPRRLKG